MKHQILTAGIVAVVLFVATVFSPHPTRAQSPRDSSPMPEGSISPQVESTLERTAAVALRHISEARFDINRKALPHAHREMSAAVRLLKTIRDDLSTATPRSLIRTARNHLKYDTAAQVLNDLTSLDDSLDRISTYLPTDKTRSHIDKARMYLVGGDTRGAERELDRADRSLKIVEIDLPLLKCLRYVTVAEGYIAARNPDKANEVLKLAERTARALYRAEHIPLNRAKQDLWLAYRNNSTQRKERLLLFLERARESLGQASPGMSPAGQEEIGSLSREISTLRQRQAVHEPIAEATLKGLWERCQALVERSAAYLSAGLSEAETTLSGENDLIEARLHVAYAETYQVTTGEPDKATGELAKASGYLEHASGSRTVSPADRKKLQGIGSILDYLNAHSDKGDAAVQDRYDAVTDELDGLIQNM